MRERHSRKSFGDNSLKACRASTVGLAVGESPRFERQKPSALGRITAAVYKRQVSICAGAVERLMGTCALTHAWPVLPSLTSRKPRWKCGVSPARDQRSSSMRERFTQRPVPHGGSTGSRRSRTASTRSRSSAMLEVGLARSSPTSARRSVRGSCHRTRIAARKTKPNATTAVAGCLSALCTALDLDELDDFGVGAR